MYEEVGRFYAISRFGSTAARWGSLLLARGKIPFIAFGEIAGPLFVSQDGCIFFLGQRERKEMESRFSSLFCIV